MMESSVEATISQSVEKVFSYLLQFEKQTEYNNSVKKSHALPPSPQGNPRFHIEIDLGIFQMKEVYELKTVETPQRIVAVCEGSSLKFTDTYEFFAKGESTLLKITDRMELKGLLSWSEPLAHPILKKQMQENMQRLKAILESM